MEYIVVKERKTDYPDPIIVKKGDRVLTFEKCDVIGWENWIKCEVNMKKGWVPIQVLKKIDNRNSIANEDYTANELTIEIGDKFIKENEMNGWSFGFLEKEPKIKGWIPNENIQKMVD